VYIDQETWSWSAKLLRQLDNVQVYQYKPLKFVQTLRRKFPALCNAG